MKWFRFMDMCSGGGIKYFVDGTAKSMIYVQADTEESAIEKFTNQIGKDPNNVTCQCCGEDYSITEHKTLEQATGNDRNCIFSSETEQYEEISNSRYGEYISLDEYKKYESILIIE